MHPVNSLNFGPSGIKVRFNNGSSVVDGWIVKQLSWLKFIVTADGTNKFIVKFISSSSTPQVGEFTIIATPFGGGTEHVKRIDGHHIETYEGNRYIWVSPSTTAVAGDATLAHY